MAELDEISCVQSHFSTHFLLIFLIYLARALAILCKLAMVDRVIAWLNEVATVAHNNTSRRLGKKNTEYIITSELNLEWEH